MLTNGGTYRMRRVAITTIDNPYDPFTQFNEWYAYDELKGYHSCSLLARFANTSIDLSFDETNYKIEQAIDRIVNLNGLGNYRKLIKDD